MKHKRWMTSMAVVLLASGVLTACGGKEKGSAKEGDSGEISMALRQVGEIPEKGNPVEQAIEAYTKKKLNIQWIPQAAFDEKMNVMIASGEMPEIVKVNYVPTILGAIENGTFWEIGPYLKDYKNLSAQDPVYYENISVKGKIYGIPNFRDIGRAAIMYRKDWFDALGLEVLTTLDGWYTVLKALTLNDPDKNGKNDTFGTVLFKEYNDGTKPVITRLAVSQGAPNRWGVDDNGKFTPDFMTEPYFDVLNLFRRLYEEKLINQDFAAFDTSEADKMMTTGRVGVRFYSVAQNGRSYQEMLNQTVKNGVLDVVPFEGPDGIRIAGEPGNFGFLAVPKSSVETEEELKEVLGFLDQLMDEPMSTLQLRGIEGEHFAALPDGKSDMKDMNGFNKEVKPYRDNLLNVEGYNVPELNDTPLGKKGTEMARDNLKYSIPNPALTLSSPTYFERGKELEQMISDAQTKFIMGKIDEAGWKQEIDKWRQAGGDQMIREYEEAYVELKQGSGK